MVSLFKITFRLSGRSLFIFSVGFDIDLRWLPCVDHRAAQEESDGRELQNKNQFDCQADGTKSSQPTNGLLDNGERIFRNLKGQYNAMMLEDQLA